MRTLSRTVACLLALVAFSAPACATGSRVAPPSARCVAVFDVDVSTASVPGLHDRYLDWFSGLARHCADEHALLTLLTASDQSLTDAGPLISRDLAPQLSGGNRQDEELEVAANVARARGEAERMVTEASSGSAGTDLLGALLVAADHLGAPPETPRENPHRLVLYTDGLHTRPPYNLTAIALDDASLPVIVEELRLSGQLPALGGVDVEIVGAGVGADAAVVEPARMARIESFWRTLIETAGGQLVTWNKAPVVR